MEEFCEADHYVSDLHYNDVAIMTSGLSGVEGSVAEISTEQPTVHTFTFNTSEALNAQGNPILFDPNKLRVVAILLEDNGQYGIVENATKCKVENLSGVEGVMADRQVETVNYYDLQGRAITNPGNGMCVRITRYTDGSINADKIIKGLPYGPLLPDAKNPDKRYVYRGF